MVLNFVTVCLPYLVLIVLERSLFPLKVSKLAHRIGGGIAKASEAAAFQRPIADNDRNDDAMKNDL